MWIKDECVCYVKFEVRAMPQNAVKVFNGWLQAHRNCRGDHNYLGVSLREKEVWEEDGR